MLLAKYSYGEQIKEDEMGGKCGTQGGIREMYIILFGKSEGKRPLGRPTRRWDANIKLDFKGNS